jgi:hypothetical protein
MSREDYSYVSKVRLRGRMHLVKSRSGRAPETYCGLPLSVNSKRRGDDYPDCAACIENHATALAVTRTGMLAYATDRMAVGDMPSEERGEHDEEMS